MDPVIFEYQLYRVACAASKVPFIRAVIIKGFDVQADVSCILFCVVPGVVVESAFSPPVARFFFCRIA